MNLLHFFAEVAGALKKPKTGEHQSVYDTYGGSSIFDSDAGNPNDFYEEMRGVGGVSEAVDKMEGFDPKLFGWMQTRKLALLTLEQGVQGNGEIADFVRGVFAGWKGWHNTCLDLLSCIQCGFSVIEKVWSEKDGRFVIEKLKNWSQDKFTFKDGRLHLGDGFIQDEADQTKFSVLTFMPKNGNPWGSALYQKIYNYWFMKKHVTKFWAVYEERFGAPITHAKIPDSDFENENSPLKRAIKKFLSEVHKKSGPHIVTGQDVEIILKEANANGATGAYEKFVAFLDSSIVIAILGQTLTSETTGTGSFALGKVHDAVRQDILAADAVMLSGFINDELIRPLVDFNFDGVTEYPKYEITLPNAENKKELAETVEILSRSGVKTIPISYIHKKIGIPTPVNEEACLEPTQSPAAGQVTQDGAGLFAESVREKQIKAYLADLDRYNGHPRI